MIKMKLILAASIAMTFFATASLAATWTCPSASEIQNAVGGYPSYSNTFDTFMTNDAFVMVGTPTGTPAAAKALLQSVTGTYSPTPIKFGSHDWSYCVYQPGQNITLPYAGPINFNVVVAVAPTNEQEALKLLK